MRTMFEGMKQILVVEPAVTIRSALDQDSRKALENLADVLTQKQ